MLTAKFIEECKRRDHLCIMAEIMGVAESGESKTQIMNKANISFNQLTKYLRILTRLSLLEKTLERGKEIFTVTKKGRDFLAHHEQIMKLLSEEPQTDSIYRVKKR